MTTVLEKFTVVGLIAMTGTPTPVPLSATVGAVPGALLLTVMVAARAPVAVGVKVTLMVVLAPGAMVVVAGVAAKSPGLAPLSGTPERVSGAVPVLVTVALCALLVTFTFVLGKGSELGVTLMPA